MKVQNRKMAKGYIAARTLPETFNLEARTIEVVWSTGMPVKRMDFFTGKFFIEELSMEPGDIRLDRLNLGAPVLDTHDQTELSKVIGVVERASVANGQGTATLKLSDTDGDAEIIRKIQDGIIKNISVGYKIHRAEETIDEESNMSTFRVVDWEPLEISFVPVPADFNSQARNEGEEKSSIQSFDCEIIVNPSKGVRMANESKDVLLRDEESNAVETPTAEETPKTEGEQKEGETKEDEAKADESKEETSEEKTEAESCDKEVESERSLVTQERERVLEIMDMCKRHDIDSKISSRFIESNVSIKDAGSLILKEIEKRGAAKITNNRVETTGMDNKKLRSEAMTRGLLNLVDPMKNKLKDGDREYRPSSIQSAARMYLANEMGERNVHTMSKTDVAQRALHHSSDFPLILENLANKFLQEGFAEVAATYSPFVRNRSVDDFKEVSESRISTGGLLQRVNEHGEYKRSSLASDGEKYRIEKFGEIIGVTEELLVNDDLGAFTGIPQELGAKVARTENELFWELIYTPQVMSDGIALFDAAHGNLAATGSAISVESLSDMRSAMRLQRDLDGQKRLNIRPAFLIVPAALETTAERFLTTVQADSATNVNPFGSSMQMIVEPILDDLSDKCWYGFGSLAQGPMAVRATLNGQGPQISVRQNWDIDGMETKIKYHFGMRIVDHRQFYKNAGA